ncbi:MAG: hypothetical protein ACP5JG_13285 [Anaerolineae bacterium]
MTDTKERATPRTPLKSRRCTALRRDGTPCAAWAVRGSEPPRCSSHGGRALVSTSGAVDSTGPDGGPDHLGLPVAASPYGQRARREDEPNYDLSSIEDVVADLAEKQRLVSEYIEEQAADMEVDQLAHLLALHARTASRLGRLLRDQRALSGDAADGIAGAIAQALDELSTELGTDL